MSAIDIFKIREDLKLTQQEFGELIGVDRRTVINYEQGKKIPTSKIKLLELLLKNGSVSQKEAVSSTNEQAVSLATDNLQREILDLQDHIKTLKAFLDEKTKVTDMYRNENAMLKEKLDRLT